MGTDIRIPKTPVGEQLLWYLEVMSSDMGDLTVEEVNAHMAHSLELADAELRDQWSGWSARLGHCTITGIDHSATFEMTVAIATDKEARYRLSLTVETEAPHKIVNLDWNRVYDFDVVVREATVEDGPALAEIELRAPIVMGDSRMTFDRSEDYFAAARLMEDATVVMAEVDGVPAAVEWAAWHRARIGGTEYRLTNYIHLRVAAEHQRKGLWGALASKLSEKYPPEIKTDCGYACAARVNAAIQRGFQGRPRWSVGPFRALISAAEQAGPPAGRSASHGDVEQIVELLNHSHGQEEMYFPYTAESLLARLGRAPDLYSLDQVWLTDNAIVGLWPAGNQTRVITETDGQTTEARYGLVLDYGFLPGAEVEFEKLLRAWCGWLADHDHSHLSIFTSEASTGYPMIQRLAAHLERFDIWTPPIPEPEGATQHGIYMDQVYF